MNYKQDQILTATIRAPRVEGIIMDVPGVSSAIMSPTAWGKGEARMMALKAMKRGDRLRCRVRNFYPQTNTLALELAESVAPETVETTVMPSDSTVSAPVPSEKFRKPDYELLEPGTVCVWNASSLLRKIDMKHPVQVMETISAALAKIGCKSVYVLDRSVYYHTLSKLESEAEQNVFKAFTKRDEVSLVWGYDEANDVTLQFVEAIPNSIAITCANCENWEKVSPDLLAKRVCSFARVWLDDKLFLSFRGLKNAIVLTEPTTEPAIVGPSPTPGTESAGTGMDASAVMAPSEGNEEWPMEFHGDRKFW